MAGLAHRMRDGRWTPAPAISLAGAALTAECGGYHRLAAIVEYGRPVLIEIEGWLPHFLTALVRSPQI